MYGDTGLFKGEDVEQGFQEADIHAGIRTGGYLQSAFIVVRPASVPEEVTYVAYLRTSWRVGYHLLELSRYRGERIYRNLGRLVFLLQESFSVRSPLQIYRAGCSELRRFRALQPQDRDEAASWHRANPAPDRPTYRFPAEDPEEE